jgi:hypothetical protein
MEHKHTLTITLINKHIYPEYYGRKLAHNEIAKAPTVAKVFKKGSRAENAFAYHMEVYSDSPTLG